jgi:glyoxylase I family protein
MEKVTGIGGLFFRAKDPDALGLWYKEQLGIDMVPADYSQSPWMQEAGPTVIAPFPQDTTYLGSATNHWMINFRVRDLEAMVKQLRGKGIDVLVDSHVYPNGRFARLQDPEGNPIELWEPTTQ